MAINLLSNKKFIIILSLIFIVSTGFLFFSYRENKKFQAVSSKWIGVKNLEGKNKQVLGLNIEIIGVGYTGLLTPKGQKKRDIFVRNNREKDLIYFELLIENNNKESLRILHTSDSFSLIDSDGNETSNGDSSEYNLEISGGSKDKLYLEFVVDKDRFPCELKFDGEIKFEKLEMTFNRNFSMSVCNDPNSNSMFYLQKRD